MNRRTKRIQASTQSLGSEVVRDEAGRIVDVYVLCLGDKAPKPLPEFVLKGLAQRVRTAKPSLN